MQGGRGESCGNVSPHEIVGILFQRTIEKYVFVFDCEYKEIETINKM